jgi:hypothetical protein
MIRLLFIGDIVGEPGRQAIARLVPYLREREKIDLVIANSENAAGGLGVTRPIVDDLFKSGIDVLTSGNHAWDKKEGIPLYDEKERLLRPANYPTTKYYHTPGKGSIVVETKAGIRVAILNLMGRVFMDSYDCPFQVADRELEVLSRQAKVIFVDFHAETTSEKRAIGFFLDGRVSAIVGTHTHVQTADEQILKNGTAYLTDAGMTGPHDSVIGMDKEKVLQRFLTKRPAKYDVGSGDVRLQGAVIEIDEETGKSRSIQRVNEKL